MNASAAVRVFAASVTLGALGVCFGASSQIPPKFGDPVSNYEQASVYTLSRFIDGDAKSVTWTCSTPGTGKKSVTRLYGWYQGTIEAESATKVTRVWLHQVGGQNRKRSVRLRVDPTIAAKVTIVEYIKGANPRTLKADASGFYEILASEPSSTTSLNITYEMTFTAANCKVECYFSGWAPDNWPDFTSAEIDDGSPPPPSLDGEH